MRTILAGAASAIACAAVCAPASAGVYTSVYEANPGEVNHVVVSFDGSFTTFTDSAGATVENPDPAAPRR